MAGSAVASDGAPRGVSLPPPGPVSPPAPHCPAFLPVSVRNVASLGALQYLNGDLFVLILQKVMGWREVRLRI